MVFYLLFISCISVTFFLRLEVFLKVHFIYFFPPQIGGAGFDEKSNKKIKTVEKKLKIGMAV